MDKLACCMHRARGQPQAGGMTASLRQHDTQNFCWACGGGCLGGRPIGRSLVASKQEKAQQRGGLLPVRYLILALLRFMMLDGLV
jgi:hypothetical protein